MSAAPLPNAPAALPPRARTLRRRLLLAGGAGLALTAFGAFLDGRRSFQAYLCACIFWTGIALGSLAVAMMHNLTTGEWGTVARRPLECAGRLVALMAALFVPLVIAFPFQLALHNGRYPREQQAFLGAAPFMARQVIYFAIWIWLAFRTGRLSEEQDRATAEARPGAVLLRKRMRRLSAPGLVLYGLTVSFAAVDWIMSFEPGWYSTVFGLILIAGQLLSAIAFAIVCLQSLTAGLDRPLASLVEPRHFHDLGKLLLCFVMIWAYVAFSQLLIIWSGNLPEEIPWYLRRWTGGWGAIGATLIALQFGLPFLLLLSRRLKRSGAALAGVAVLVLVMRALDLYWMVGAEISPGQPFPRWMDFAAAVGVGGVWLAFLLLQLEKRTLVPATVLAAARVRRT